jgi:hypothetical protein
MTHTQSLIEQIIEHLSLTHEEKKEYVGLHGFAVACPAENLTVFHCGLSAFFWADIESGFPATTFSLVSPVFPQYLSVTSEASVTVTFPFALASGISP